MVTLLVSLTPFWCSGNHFRELVIGDIPSNGVIRDGVGNSGHFLSSLTKSSVWVFPPYCWFHLLYKSFQSLIRFVWPPVNLAFLLFCSWCAYNWVFSSACIIIKSARCILLWIAYSNSQTSNGSKFKRWGRLGDIFFLPIQAYIECPEFPPLVG